VIAVRGIRGATTVDADEPEQIVEATRELLETLTAENGIVPTDVAAAWFTVTPDLHSEFPAAAARRAGWVDVPLICSREIDVPASNPLSVARCIRTLILLNTSRSQGEIRHVYLRGAAAIKEILEQHRATAQGRAS
jgi:chorismate mutase